MITPQTRQEVTFNLHPEVVAVVEALAVMLNTTNSRALTLLVLEGVRHQDKWIKERQTGAVTPSDCCVYYIWREVDGLIKIGTSTNIKQRMETIRNTIGHIELLAMEPGHLRLESQRHRRFAHLRVYGEWFKPGDDLIEHIQQLRGLSKAS